MSLVIFALLIAFAVSRPSRFEQIAKEVNSRRTTWIAEESAPFRDYARLIGTLPNTVPLPSKTVDVVKNFPESFNALEKWPECKSITEIRDQGECASCWAVGVAEVATDRLCISSNGKDQSRLSAEDLLGCCDSCGMKCKGGYTGMAWEYVRQVGIVTGGANGNKEWCNEYAFPKCSHGIQGSYPECSSIPPEDPECSTTCIKGYPIPYDQDRHKMKSAFQLENDVNQIKSEIFANGPVEATFQVFEDFMTYKSGIYQHVTGKRVALHTVKLIGWGVEGGVPFWRVVNSWNEEWGEEGQFRIRLGTNECSIEAQVEGGMF